VNHIVRGGEPEAQYARLRLQTLVERGALTPGEFGALERGYLDPSFSFITRTNFGAWGSAGDKAHTLLFHAAATPREGAPETPDHAARSRIVPGESLDVTACVPSRGQ
jgi:hypothetical protein